MTVSNSGKLVTIFGGSGFVGRHLVRAMAKRGYRVRVAVRRPDLAGHLQPLGNVGQITAIQANLRYRWSVERAVEGADAVINLVGIMHETGKQKFTSVHVTGAMVVAQAASDANCPLVHVSSLGSTSESTADYAISKAEAEIAVKSILPDTIVLRPSVIFGPEDKFFNLLATLARYSPVLPMIGGGKNRFQPVYVGDVAEAIANAIDRKDNFGSTYELGGPQVLTFRQCVEEVLQQTNRRNLLVPLPFALAKLEAWFLQLLPNPLLTVDQVRMLETDNVVSEVADAEGRNLAGLAVDPTPLTAILPSYLVRFKPHGQFEASRSS